MIQISNSSLLVNYTELSFALPLTAQTILSHRLTIVQYATFYTIQIPSIAPPSDTINMRTTHSNILYPTSSPPIAISYSKIPYPYGIYHTPYFVASTSAPELCQPHQTLALTPPVLCPREPRPGGEPCMYSYICEISVRFGTYLFIRALLAKP